MSGELGRRPNARRVGNKMRKKYNFVRIILVLALVITGVVVALLISMKSSSERERARMEQVLTDSARDQANTFTTRINDQFDVLTSCAEYAAAAFAENVGRDAAYFELILNSGGFTDVGVAGTDGIINWLRGEDGADVSGREYFKNAVAGSSNIYFIMNGSPEGGREIVYSVPVISGGCVVGAMIAKADVACFVNLLSSEVSGGKGYSFVCDSEGRLLVEPESTDFVWKTYFESDIQASLFEALKSVQFFNGGSLEKFRSDIKNGVAGAFSYKYKSIERYGIYEPLQENGWFLLNVIDSREIEAGVRSTVRTGALSVGLVLVFFVMAAGGVMYFERENKRASEAEREKIDLAEREEKRLIIENNERFRLALQTISTSTWDFDLATRSIHQSDDSIDQHGFTRVVENVPDSLIDCGYVHPDSVAELRDIYDRILAGENSAEGIIKVQLPDGSGWWYEHIRYFNLFDNKGVPYRAVGMGQDVTDRQQLLTAAVSDPLTGLLNHNAVISRISSAISEDNESGYTALYMIDIDNFKSVNDTMGHQTGDEVLKKIADIIKGVFRTGDLVGRIGGDEYVALLRNAPNLEVVRQKADKLINLMQMHCSDSSGGDISLSASVGVAVCNRGDSFDQLFRRADSALYVAKNKGKNRYSIDTDSAGQLLPEEPENNGLSIVQLQMLMEDIDGGVVLFETGNGYKIRYISPGFYKLVGITRDDNLSDGTWLLDMVEPKAKTKLLGLIDRCVQLGDKIDYSYRIITVQGQDKWRHIRAVRSMSEDGVPQVLALVTDITELSRADRILSTIVEHSPYGIGIFDAERDYRPLFANDLLLKRAHCTREQFFARPGLDVLNGIEYSEIERLKEAIRLAGAEKRSVETIVEVNDRPGGPVHRIRMNIVIADIDGDRVAYITFYDITNSLLGEAGAADGAGADK